MCLYPRLVKNPKYRENKKNGGLVPPVSDIRVLYVPIGCGNCMECRKRKSREWQVRLLEDLKQHKNGKFITLTFSNESLRKLYDDIHKHQWRVLYSLPYITWTYPHKDILRRLRKTFVKQCKQYRKTVEKGYDLDNLLATRAVRLLCERWRKHHGTSIRHWLVTELGHNGTENIHLHGIIWTDEPMSKIEKHWKYGFIWKGNMIKGKLENYVNEKTVNYITKYVSKMDLIHQKYKPVILTSSGIGGQYVNSINARNNKFKDSETDETYRTRTGHKINMPVYWRNKLYNDEEKEKLWLQKLDKEERWVLGQRINIRKGEDSYYDALKWAHEQNKSLGYGSCHKDWNREKYEHERRKLIQNIRLKQ